MCFLKDSGMIFMMRGWCGTSEGKEVPSEGQFCFMWKQFHWAILIKGRKIRQSRFKTFLFTAFSLSVASFETPVKVIKKNAQFTGYKQESDVLKMFASRRFVHGMAFRGTWVCSGIVQSVNTLMPSLGLINLTEPKTNLQKNVFLQEDVKINMACRCCWFQLKSISVLICASCLCDGKGAG